MKRVSALQEGAAVPVPHPLTVLVLLQGALGGSQLRGAPSSEALKDSPLIHPLSPVMYCTDPGEVEHSTRLISDPVLLVGTTIQYTCNPGFVLEGSSLLTCYSRETGTPIWTSRLPHCVCKPGCSLLLPCTPSPLWGSWVAFSCSQDPARLWGVVQILELPGSRVG